MACAHRLEVDYVPKVPSASWRRHIEFLSVRLAGAGWIVEVSGLHLRAAYGGGRLRKAMAHKGVSAYPNPGDNSLVAITK